MATRRFDPNKEQSIARLTGYSPTDRGNGGDDHLPIGKWSYDTNFLSRGLIRFAHDWSGMYQVTKIELHIRLTSETHTAQGGSRRTYIGRCQATWDSGGGGENSWAWGTGVGEVYPGPTATDYNDYSTSGSNGTWLTIDITATYDNYIPTYVNKPSGSPGGGSTNYGIRLWSYDESVTGRTAEFYGMRSSSPPYIIVTYTTAPPVTNNPPTTPTLSGPANGATIAAGTQPAFSFVGADEAGDSLASFDLQVATDAAFTSLVHNANHTPGAYFTSPQTVTNFPYTYGGLSAGGTYYWRVRTYDTIANVSPWSASRSFTMGVTLPSVSAMYPGASQLAPIWNATELATWTTGGSHAKPQVSWTYQHAGGLAGTHYRVRIYNDAGATVYDTPGGAAGVALSQTIGTVYYYQVPFAIVLGTQYRWSVEVRDSAGNWSTTMATGAAASPFKVRWGQAVYSHNVTVSATNVQVKPGTLAGGAAVNAYYLYRTADDALGTNATAWVSSPGSIATMKAYLQILVRLTTYVAGQNPALADLTLTYSGGVTLTPDKWTVGGGTMALDAAVKRFGQYGLRLKTTGTGVYVYPYHFQLGDGVDVQDDTDYTISAWVSTGGAALRGGSTAQLIIQTLDNVSQSWWLSPQPSGMIHQTTDSSAYPNDWQQLVGVFHVPPGVTTIRPMLWAGNAMAAGDQVWWDGVRLEQGRVAQSWTPGFLSDGGVIDSHGVTVDASQGGIFRLRGSNDPNLYPRAFLELWQQGLRYGGDTELTSPSVGVMAVNSTPISLNTHTHASTPNSPTTVQRFLANGTWNKPAGLVAIRVRAIGGGGGGGGCPTTAAGQGACGAGGGGGAYTEAWYAAASLGATVAVTVGQGGNGGGGTGTGVAGTASSFGGLTAPGGAGGGTSGASASNALASSGAGGVPGAGPAGAILGTGSDGQNGNLVGGFNLATGMGGGTALGGWTRTGFNVAGTAGSFPGGGGSGAGQGASQAAVKNGGAGADGIVIVEEFY